MTGPLDDLRPLAGRSLHLVGGGWDRSALPAVYGPFLEAAGPSPTVACVVLDEGDGGAQFARWDGALRAAGPCAPVPVLVPRGRVLDVADLGDADALLVCGGLTPAYAAALGPVAADVRAWLDAGPRPCAGFSAGAAVAAGVAVVGGWRVGGVPVCPPDAGEDLDEVAVEPGLGLVDATVEVHCAAWGTLPRLLAAVAQLPGSRGVALDEDTALHVTADGGQVRGLGSVRHVRADGGRAVVETVRARG